VAGSQFLFRVPVGSRSNSQFLFGSSPLSGAANQNSEH
jgi:hypothetical protein